MGRSPSHPAADGQLEPWLTQAEICEHFKVGTRWVDRMVKLGMPYVRIGKRRKFKASACEEWLRWTGVIDDERL